MPLQTIVATCDTVVKTDELKKFELLIGHAGLSSKMELMACHCQLVMLRLDDMQDLALMIDGKFKKRSNFFDFHETFRKIQKMMQVKASLKNVNLQFSSMFQSDPITFRKESIEQI